MGRNTHIRRGGHRRSSRRGVVRGKLGSAPSPPSGIAVQAYPRALRLCYAPRVGGYAFTRSMWAPRPLGFAVPGGVPVGALGVNRMPGSGELVDARREVRRIGAFELDLFARDGAGDEEGPRLDAIGDDLVFGAVELRHAFDDDPPGAGA